MDSFNLIKLLYLLDRTALLRWGFQVTTDEYASLDDGPIVNNIYNFIMKRESSLIWSELISAPGDDNEAHLLTNAVPPNDRISPAEENLTREMIEQYGHMSRSELRDFAVHNLPEWEDPHGLSIPIPISAILEAGEDEEDEIKAIERELKIIGAGEEVIPGT